PLLSGLRGSQGCRLRTVKPKRKVTMLNSMNATQYCFQFCGPVSSFSSIQRSQAGTRSPPSKTRAMYNPSGMDRAKVVARIRRGRVHMCAAAFRLVGLAFQPDSNVRFDFISGQPAITFGIAQPQACWLVFGCERSQPQRVRLESLTCV